MARKVEDLKNIQAKERAEFSPTKNYTWGADDKFILTGLELDKLNRALVNQTGDLSSFQKFLWIQEGIAVVNNILKESYDEGIIKEVVPKPQDAPGEMKVVETPKAQEKESVEEAKTE